MQATVLGATWLSLATRCAAGFTAPGQRRFVEWVTGLALNVEEHTITQSLLGLGRAQDGKARETFAEVGCWELVQVQQAAARLGDTAPGRLWHGYRVWAGDDTKVHRTSAHVWGTCTFHAYTARCPPRASTVRAHNGVVLGARLHHPDQPAWFVPVAGQLYFRKSPLPAQHGTGGPREPFHTKCELLVTAVRQETTGIPGPHWVVVDGGFALRSVVRPRVRPDDPALPRSDSVTRLRHEPACTPCPRRRVGRGSAAQRPVGAGACRRRGRAVAGPGRGKPARRSSRGVGARCVGRR